MYPLVPDTPIRSPVLRCNPHPIGGKSEGTRHAENTATTAYRYVCEEVESAGKALRRGRQRAVPPSVPERSEVLAAAGHDQRSAHHSWSSRLSAGERQGGQGAGARELAARRRWRGSARSRCPVRSPDVCRGGREGDRESSSDVDRCHTSPSLDRHARAIRVSPDRRQASVGDRAPGRVGDPVPIWTGKSEGAKHVRERIGAVMKWS